MMPRWVARFVESFDAFLLTLAIGINVHNMIIRYTTPSYEEYERINIGRGC